MLPQWTKHNTKKELVENPHDLRPHVVLLGAGASRAALPAGDADGRKVPLMNDLIEVVGLQPLMEEAGIKNASSKNFELIYSRLITKPEYTSIVKEIERRINTYFGGMSLPDQATTYDRLLLSLRSTDVIFTFNWDPLLFDAYWRNIHTAALPSLFFLHGNVRVGACLAHNPLGVRGGTCPECGRLLIDVPLLFPIGQKDYSSNRYIKQSWDAARALFGGAFTLTIFGYSAPNSDVDAVELLRKAWFRESDRTLEGIEIIDIDSSSSLYNCWKSFTPTFHCRTLQTFGESRIARWPRRSCEAMLTTMSQGLACENFPLPETNDLATLQKFATEIAQYEVDLK